MKNWVTSLLVIVAIVSIAIALNSSQATGNVALTPEANYAPIDDHGNVYIKCEHFGIDDGWGCN
mgnify:CR=1 FL=1